MIRPGAIMSPLTVWQVLQSALICGSTITGTHCTECLPGNAAGAAGSNNNTAGVHIRFGASSNIINNNVISGNSGYGVYVYTLYASSATVQQSNTISNNRIGVTADGSAALGNKQDGVYIGDNSNNNVVGPGNVISASGAVTGLSDDGVYAKNFGVNLFEIRDYLGRSLHI